MADPNCRPAQLADAADIHAVLLGLAARLPLRVDTLEREEALYALVRNCLRSGESWVACEGHSRVIGVALAERAERGRHYAEHEVLELRHAGVIEAYREAGLLTQLIGKLLDRMVPIVAAVSPHNRSGLGESLEQLGFRLGEAAGGERQYRWEPGAKS